jgi:hypothetical protein
VNNDAKIHDIALTYITKHVVSRMMSCTIVGVLHPSLVPYLSLAEGEQVLVSAFFSRESWYAFTTRRIVSQFQGVLQSIDPSLGIDGDFPNFKGYRSETFQDFDELDENGRRKAEPGAVRREVATIRALNTGAIVRFQFETWEAAMAPMYAVRYWQVKHPVLYKLMTTQEIEDYKTHNR